MDAKKFTNITYTPDAETGYLEPNSTFVGRPGLEERRWTFLQQSSSSSRAFQKLMRSRTVMGVLVNGLVLSPWRPRGAGYPYSRDDNP
jgi:hypothetical protein